MKVSRGLTRARRYLGRADVGRDRWRLVGRRLVYELERRLIPSRLERERRVRYDADLRIWVRPADVVDRDIYLYGSHEHVTATVFSHLARPGAVVVDAGAHVGAFTLLAAKRVGPAGRVLAFEPNPQQRERLERNVATNGFDQVEIRAEALSDHAGRALLHLSADHTRSGNASLNAGEGAAGAVAVDLVRLDDLAERLAVPRVDLIKLDVEGAEADIVVGATSTIESFRPAVVFEVNDLGLRGDGTNAPAIQALRDRGYVLYGMGLTSEGAPSLVEVRPGEDPTRHREPWHALNLLALHPASARAGAYASKPAPSAPR